MAWMKHVLQDLYVETSGIGIWRGNRDFGAWGTAEDWRFGSASFPSVVSRSAPTQVPASMCHAILFPLGTLWNWAQTSLSSLELLLVGAFSRAMWRVSNKICDVCVPLYLPSRTSPPHYWKAKTLLFSLSAFQVEVVLSWENLSNTPNSHFKFLLFTCKESIMYLLSLKHCVYTLAAINALLFQVSSRFQVPRVGPFYCLL